MADKPNIKAITPFRLRGSAVKADQVVSKKDFANKGEWQNLCHMDPPRAEETSDAIGEPKAKKAAMPSGDGDK